MGNAMRWRWGETNPIVLAVHPDSLISIGDLVFVDQYHVARAAAEFPSGPGFSAEHFRRQFHDAFAGVALTQSRYGDTDLRVATTGVFEFAVEEKSTFQCGQLIGVAWDDVARRLENQTVARVGQPALAIGRCAKRVIVPEGRVLVDVVSTLMYGGPQAAAA